MQIQNQYSNAGGVYTFVLGGSFAETLYGLKRMPLNNTPSDLGVLTPAISQFLSFTSIVLVPYVKVKADQIVTKLSASDDSQVGMCSI